MAGQDRAAWAANARRYQSLGLQIVLWLIWSLAVAAVGYWAWHGDIAAHRPVNTLGLAIHCLVAGVIGLVVMTWLEMRIEPWRFVDLKK
jgi:hypothetical protein